MCVCVCVSLSLSHILVHIRYQLAKGQDSSVGIATRYGLDGPGIESRWGAIFSALVQTGPGAHTASSTITPGIFPGGKAVGAWR